ncbi:hypothetical protein [Saccharicrinis fermentans]|uniref:Uncharacterized protein n=1 Tax=Saccharicrinis fermentans DSM 9555 = JCM 21142 TaxID=869213 RepID=W7YER8_9BACT|nr:hypothetical protein [Saccharicrinis fermentans]GAF05968.1 hypothetical protein JCM21142_134733 [Saccharicrinis fermentans DSM 9555 = JCM 21142]
MIPKSIISQQKLLQKISIVSNLNKPLKDGLYFSRYFIDFFDQSYLDETLENWEDISDKSYFLNQLDIIVNENLEGIEEVIKLNLNSRKHLVEEIFKLYKLRFYSAMITLSLSQVDGIMKEITKRNGFYNSRNEKLKYLDDDLYVGFFSEFELLNVEKRNDYELFKKDITNMSLLNRHAILHGESVEFGHNINALKVILLLTFIAELYPNNQSLTENNK